MNQQIRIIGGVYRGKKLHFPAIEGLRPTPDRVRETLFNWLMQGIRAARCLDAFAGSGSLGFEALSRGAREVVMVEESTLVYSNLKKTAAAFPSEGLTLLCKNALDYLKTIQSPFDIIFLDPPFSSDYLETCLSIIYQGQCLVPGGCIYVESNAPISAWQSMFKVLKEKKAGQVFYGLLQDSRLGHDPIKKGVWS